MERVRYDCSGHGLPKVFVSRWLIIDHPGVCDGSSYIGIALGHRGGLSPQLSRGVCMTLGLLAPLAVALEMWNVDGTFLRFFCVGVGNAGVSNGESSASVLEDVKWNLLGSQGLSAGQSVDCVPAGLGLELRHGDRALPGPRV